MDKEFKIEIPEGYEIDKENSTFELIKFKKIVDLSILNNKDWFYIESNPYGKTLSTIAKGRIIEEFEGNLIYFYKGEEQNLRQNNHFLVQKEGITYVRKATEEEIENFYKVNPNLREKPQWGGFGMVKGYYIDAWSTPTCMPARLSQSTNKNLWPTKEEAEAALALSQLCQWRDKYNEGWKPDWTVNTVKYCIRYYEGMINPDINYCYSRVLTFKTDKIRDKFLEDFRDLIEQAKPLL